MTNLDPGIAAAIITGVVNFGIAIANRQYTRKTERRVNRTQDAVREVSTGVKKVAVHVIDIKRKVGVDNRAEDEDLKDVANGQLHRADEELY